MEAFNELLQKLKEVHEREVEGWQEKLQEMTSKKGGSDSKRMEELFNKNQYLREQQRLLTENIKQLENRLRAGLCDRCTVTQDVAKQRQQAYEASQIQYMQHVSILAAEMTALRRENQILRSEVKTLRGALEGQVAEVRRSPGLSPPSAAVLPLALRPASQPPGRILAGPVRVKTETDFSQHDEEKLDEPRRGWNGKHSSDPLKYQATSPRQRPETGPLRGNSSERRTHSLEALDQRSPGSSLPPSVLHLRDHPNSSSYSPSSLRRDETAGRNLIQAPIRPRPVKTASLSLPWPLPEHGDWVALTSSPGGRVVVNPNLQRFLHLAQNADHREDHARRLGLKRPCPERSPPGQTCPPPVLTKGPSVDQEGLFSTVPTAPPLRRSTEGQLERVFGENLREAATDTPLDLSDTGRPKAGEPKPDSKSNPALQKGGVGEGNTPDRCPRAPLSPRAFTCSSSPSSDRTISSAQVVPSLNAKEEEPEDVGRTTHPASTEDKRMTALPLSLHPVVVLESLTSGFQGKDQSCGKNAHSTEPGSSAEAQRDTEGPSSPENQQRSNRGRSAQNAETEAVHGRSLKGEREQLRDEPQ